MDDFIVLRCPSCGGQIQLEKGLEKIFCTHCGTELLLRQGADGLLAPIKARELTASARLKETQASQLVLEILNNRIKELEERANKIRHDLLQCCRDNQVDFWGRDSKELKLVNQYTQLVTGHPQLTRDILALAVSQDPKTGAWIYHLDVVERMNLPGLNEPEELSRLYQYIVELKDNSKEANQFMLILQPIVQISAELSAKRQELNKVMDGFINMA